MSANTLKKVNCLFVISSLWVTILAIVSPQTCCQTFSDLNLNVSHAGQALYNTSALYWTNEASDLQPACIIRPSDTSQVSTIVRILNQNGCRFAVRGGGHAPWPLASSFDSHGIELSLENLNQISFLRRERVAAIGAGNRWADVYGFLDPLNRSVVGGRASAVGLSGLTLGGGSSFYTAQRGFVCDNVRNFTVVLGNGSVVDANQKNNKQLYKSLKGGSNNLGIVTEFVMDTVDQKPFWGGTVLYDMNSTGDRMLENLHWFTQNIPRAPKACHFQLWFWLAPFGQGAFNWKILSIYQHLGILTSTNPQKMFPRSFLNFSSVPSLPGFSTLRMSGMLNKTLELNVAPGQRQSFATLTFKNDISVLKTVRDIFQKWFIETGGGTNATCNYTGWNVEFQTFPSSYWENRNSSGGNVLGLDESPAGEDYILMLFELTWQSPDADKILFTIGPKVINEIKAAIPDAINPFLYLNYAHFTQNPLAGYGESNLGVLKQASQVYDPDGVFQNLVPGGFKLNNSMAIIQVS